MMLFETYTTGREVDRVETVLDRGTWWLNGPEVSEFESRVADYAGSTYSVSFNSGTSALYSIFNAIPKAGPTIGEVILPSFTYPATANAVYASGMKPVFADIEKETYGLDIDDVKEKVNRRTAAICPVHFAGGICRDIEEICKLADDRNIFVIEDAAHSLGAEYGFRKAGTFGDVGMFSFSFNKIISTGAGGMLVSESESLLDKARQFGKQGKNEDGEFTSHGYNFVMPSINAAIGCAQIREIEEIILMRRQMADRLDYEIADINGIKPALTNSNQKKVYQLYNIICWDEEYRDALQDYLESNDIPTRITYKPVHKTEFYSEHHGNVELPVTEEVYDRILTLPFHLHLSDDDIDRIAEALLHFDHP